MGGGYLQAAILAQIIMNSEFHLQCVRVACSKIESIFLYLCMQLEAWMEVRLILVNTYFQQLEGRVGFIALPADATRNIVTKVSYIVNQHADVTRRINNT